MATKYESKVEDLHFVFLIFLMVRWSSSSGLGAIPPLEDAEPQTGLLCDSDVGVELPG